MTKIRPAILLEEAIQARDTIQRVVVYNTLKGSFLLDEEIESLIKLETKLTTLIVLAEARGKLADIRANRLADS